MRASADSSAPPRRPERSLLRPVLLGLLRMRWLSQMSLADTEIHWHGKRIDFAFMPRMMDAEPVAIELKVDDTRRAIEQASLNRYLTPSSWVATWTRPSERLIEHTNTEGVGLFLVAERGLYPLLYPQRGEPSTDALVAHLVRAHRRVRDILSEVRGG